MKHRLSTFASLLLGVILLVLFLYRTNPGKILLHLKSLHVSWLLLGIAFNLSSVLLRAYRWKLMLNPVKSCKFRTLTGATFIGYALSTLLPARIGEVIRPLHLATEEKFSRIAAISSIVLERLMDMTILLGMLFLAVLSLEHNKSSALVTALQSGSIIGLIIMGLLFIVILILLKHPSLRQRILEKIRWKLFKNLLKNVFDSLTFLNPGLSLISIIGLGLLIWLCVALNAYCVFKAFDMTLSFPASFMIIALMGAGFFVPSPGGVGGVHKATQVGLTEIYGVGYNLASAYALVLHAVSMVPLTIIGLIYIATEKISWSKLISLKDEERSKEES